MKRLSATLFFFISGFSNGLCAEQNVSTLRQDDLHKKELQNEMITDELRRQNKRHVLPKKVFRPSHSSSGGKTWLVTKILINQGNEKIGPDIGDVIDGYVNRHLKKVDFLHLVKNIVNRYIAAGFSTTLMGLDFSQLEKGELTVRVAWGRISKIMINGQPPSSLREKFLVSSALPNVIGRPLNIRQIDQAVDNLNNGVLSAKTRILPDVRNGYSIVNIITDSKGYDIHVKVDNSGDGDNNSGRWKLSSSITLNGPFGNGDSFNLSASQRYYNEKFDNLYNTFGAFYSLPYGPVKISLDANASFYRKHIDGVMNTFKSRGNTLDVTGKLNWVVYRAAIQKISLVTSLNYRSYKNYIENTLVRASSQSYGELAIGGEWVGNVARGVAFANISLNYGVPVLGSRSGLSLSNGSEKHSFRATGNISWQRIFRLKNIRPVYKFRAGWQYAQDSLPPNGRFSIGDRYTVRGFSSETAAGGDKGLYFSNTVEFPFSVFNDKVLLTPFAGFDMGVVRDFKAAKNARLAGMVLGSRIAAGSFSGSVALSRPFYDSRGSKRDYRFYFSSELRF